MLASRRQAYVPIVVAFASSLPSSGHSGGAWTSHSHFAKAHEAETPPSLVRPVSYAQHGVDWREGSCGSRVRQSPVSLERGLEDPPQRDFKYDYKPLNDAVLRFAATGGTLSLDVAALALGGVELDEVPFRLVRVDLRGPAEHLVRGSRQPLEIQLVHKETVSNRHLVVSILVVCENPPRGPTDPVSSAEYVPPSGEEVDFNAELQHFVAMRPPQEEGGSVEFVVTPEDPLRLDRLLQDTQAPLDHRGRFISYTGSLTTPPCEEKATWLVRRSFLPASYSQVKALTDSLSDLTSGAGNFRAVMPLNGRIFTMYKAVQSPTLDLNETLVGTARRRPFLPLGPNARTDGELQALHEAQAARAETEYALDNAEATANRIKRSRNVAADTRPSPFEKVMNATKGGGARQRFNSTPFPEPPEKAFREWRDLAKNRTTEVLREAARHLANDALAHANELENGFGSPLFGPGRDEATNATTVKTIMQGVAKRLRGADAIWANG